MEITKSLEETVEALNTVCNCIIADEPNRIFKKKQAQFVAKLDVFEAESGMDYATSALFFTPITCILYDNINGKDTDWRDYVRSYHWPIDKK